VTARAVIACCVLGFALQVGGIYAGLAWLPWGLPLLVLMFGVGTALQALAVMRAAVERDGWDDGEM